MGPTSLALRGRDPDHDHSVCGSCAAAFRRVHEHPTELKVGKTITAKQSPPFPVVLDLSDDRTYTVLTVALGAFAETARAEAADEGRSGRTNRQRVDNLNATADAAESLLEDIERQLTQARKTLS
jgi:hypothetical protein